MRKKIEKELEGLPDYFVVLTILPRETYDIGNMEIIKHLLKDKDSMGAYVTINRPYQSMIQLMKRNKVNHNNLFFIDCVSEKEEEVDNCVFIKTPKSLTNLGISLESIYKSKEHSFIMLDSLNGLGLFHESNLIIRFARSMINKVREHNMKGVMIGLHEDTDPRIINELAVVCDKIIHLE